MNTQARWILSVGCILMAAVIAAAPAQAADVFAESFDGATFPPTGWTISNGIAGAVVWKLNTAVQEPNATGATGKAVMVYSTGSPRTTYNTSLITPAISLPAASTNLKLVFRQVLETWSGDETADVDISTDGGTTWTNLWRKKNIDREAGLVSISLSAYLNNSVKFRFRYYNTTAQAWDLWWQIDDVRVATVLTGDITGDGKVNIFDLQRMALSWNKLPGQAGYDPACDLTGDGKVNIFDLQAMAQNWNKTA